MSGRSNVVLFPMRRRAQTLRLTTPLVARGREFDHLTGALVLDQFRRGVLPEGVIVALLAAVGLEDGHATNRGLRHD